MLIIGFCPFFGSFGQKFTSPTLAEYSVENCKGCKSDEGVASFIIVVKHKKEEKGLEKAKIAAIDAIITRGIPGTPVSSPLLSISQYQKSKKEVEELINSDLGKGFVAKANINPLRTIKIKDGPFKGGYEIAVDVQVMYINLRQYLIGKKIKSFGL